MTAAALHRALVDAGLRVRQYPGWETRGGSWAHRKPIGIMHHHTAAPVPFPVDRLAGQLIKCNINTKPDGTVWLVAYGACNYSSGSGSSTVLAEVLDDRAPTRNARDRGLLDDTNGNPLFFNFENDHAGTGGPLPSVQEEAIVVATRVTNEYFELSGRNMISHACWTARKHDPYWNGNRRAIDDIRSQLDIPEEEEMEITPQSDRHVKRIAQAALGVPLTGAWDSDLRQAIKTHLAPHTNDPEVNAGNIIRGAAYTAMLEKIARDANQADIAELKARPTWTRKQIAGIAATAGGVGGVTMDQVFQALRQALGG